MREKRKDKFGGFVMKIITLCGNLKFKKEMMSVPEKMSLKDKLFY